MAHTHSEWAVELPLKKAAASAEEQQGKNSVEEDPNVTVSKDSKTGNEISCRGEFLTWKSGRKKKQTSTKGVRHRQLPSEGRAQEDRAVWSVCCLIATLMSPAGDDTSRSKKECTRSSGV